MVNCRFNTRVFHALLALPWTFMFLPTLIAQQDNVVHRPLPDINQLLSDVLENPGSLRGGVCFRPRTTLFLKCSNPFRRLPHPQSVAGEGGAI